MPVKSVQDLLLNELRDIYDAEKQLVRALPKMAKASSSEQLRQAFQEHLEETKHQVERLEQAFDRLDTAARGKRCEAMKGLIDEATSRLLKNGPALASFEEVVGEAGCAGRTGGRERCSATWTLRIGCRVGIRCGRSGRS